MHIYNQYCIIVYTLNSQFWKHLRSRVNENKQALITLQIMMLIDAAVTRNARPWFVPKGLSRFYSCWVDSPSSMHQLGLLPENI